MPEAPTSQASVVPDRASEYAFALGTHFPQLNADDLTRYDEAGGDLVRVEWEDWTALFPQTETAAARLRVMSGLMPHLRGFVSPSVPIWEVAGDSPDWNRQWHAARRLEGRPLHPDLIVEQNRERLVRDLATFFHELHEFSVERARGLGASSIREWRDEHEALSRRTLGVLRSQLSWSRMTWARRWWSRFLGDDAIWKIQPSLVHGGIEIERLLVDPLVQQLSAVTGWHGVRVADPAIDFAHLIDAYGTELGWRVVEHYGELGSTADAALFRRIRLHQTVNRFREVVEAADRGDQGSEALSEAIGRLR